MALSKVNMPEFSSTFSVLDVGFENGPRTFSLSPDHTSHGELKMTFFVSQVLNTFALEIYIIWCNAHPLSRITRNTFC